MASVGKRSSCNYLFDIAFPKETIFGSKPHVRHEDSHLFEYLFQNLASDVLSSFSDEQDVDVQFTSLWSNYCTSIQNTEDQSRKSVNKTAREEYKPVIVDTKKKQITRPDTASKPTPTVTVELDVESKASSLVRKLSRELPLSVAERRQLFESTLITQKRDHCSLEDISFHVSPKKFKGNGSAREKKNFWESMIRAEEEAKNNPWKITTKPTSKLSATLMDNQQVSATKKIQRKGTSYLLGNRNVCKEQVNHSLCQTLLLFEKENKQQKEEEEMLVPNASPLPENSIASSSPITVKASVTKTSEKETPPNIAGNGECQNNASKSALLTYTDHDSLSLFKELKLDVNLDDSGAENGSLNTSVEFPLELKTEKATAIKGGSSLSSTQLNDENDVINSKSFCSTDVKASVATDFIYDDFDEYSSLVGDDYAHQLLETEFTPKFGLSSKMGKMLGVNPEKCKAYGVGLTIGRLNYENVFYVSTEGAGIGFLTVGIQGPIPNQVKRITVEEDRDNLYRVSYSVKCVGYFIIFIRFNDCFIMDSPFVSQVSDTHILI